MAKPIPGSRYARRIDADDFAVSVGQRSTRVSRVNAGIGLDGVRDNERRFQNSAPQCTDDSGADCRRALKVESESDGDHFFTRLQSGRIPEGGRHQTRSVDLENRQVQPDRPGRHFLPGEEEPVPCRIQRGSGLHLSDASKRS
jgi:hypothetical protein